MRSLRGVLWLVLLGTIIPGALRGQSDTDRQMLAAWDDSLLAIRSRSALEPLARRASGPTAAGALRQILYRLRQAQLTSRAGDVDRALGALLLEAGRHQDWPWPHLVLARAFAWLQGQDFGRRGWTGVPDGQSMTTMAWHHLALMDARDPTFARGQDYLFDLLAAQGDRTMTPRQQAVVEREMRQPSPRPQAQVVWGRMRRTAGDLLDALAAFQRAQEGLDTAAVAVEVARTARALGDTAQAREAYWAGVDRLTPAGRIAYRYDLEWILDERELQSFERLAAGEVPGWIRRFWARQDALAANTPGEALLDHLARWDQALRAFRLTDGGRSDRVSEQPDALTQEPGCSAGDPLLDRRTRDPQPSLPGDLRARERLIDHRGQLYLRHGRPLRVVGGEQSAEAEREDLLEQLRRGTSWTYLQHGRYRSLHFAGSAGLGMEEATTLAGGVVVERPLWFEPRPRESATEPLAERILALCAPAGTPPGERERMAASIPTLNRVQPELSTLWEGTSSAAALGGRGAEHRVLMTWAIAGRHLRQVPDDRGFPTWPVRLRIVAWDDASGRTLTFDTLMVVTSPPTRASRGFVTGWLELSLPQGLWTLALRGSQGQPHEGLYLVHPPLPLTTRAGPGLSDIVLGGDGGRLWVAPDGRGFPMHPVGVWAREAPLPLYLEVEGVPSGENIDLSVHVTRIGPTRSASIDRSLPPFPAAGPRTPIRESLMLDMLEPGPHRLTVRLRTGGHSIEHSVVFHVVAF